MITDPNVTVPNYTNVSLAVSEELHHYSNKKLWNAYNSLKGVKDNTYHKVEERKVRAFASQVPGMQTWARGKASKRRQSVNKTA